MSSVFIAARGHKKPYRASQMKRSALSSQVKIDYNIGNRKHKLKIYICPDWEQK